ncbi:DUF1828 domain-containing protein [Confluentibacter flavum]|uniref:DUF1828 domain-containing protein n=1 Tax=Confluentibacter flavum TaxID=1909700 RepID=A0A2N3HMU1_9FLAO|nr:DUF1828 domain-containing protein [Confluentibacter flavum]PKQ46290.1 hypothetical protein CSW08_03775 [Confluentibacter flavum]
MEHIIQNIKNEFNGKLFIKQKRPDIYQLLLPIYHEDGDMIDLFITPKGDNKFALCDYGLTLQRLAYSYDIDTENKESILQKILSENKLNEQEGNIYLETKPETLFSDIMHITQAYAKIGSMRYFKREVIENLFFEMLDDFIFDELNEFHPKKKVMPIPNRDDLEADYSFQPNGKPVYLFGVKDVAKARLATLSYQAYLLNDIKYHGWVVTENFEALPRKDKLRLTNTCDKQFTSLDEFKMNAKVFLEKER